MKNKILIATGNKGKFAEFKQIFTDNNLNYQLISTEEFNLAEPTENGQNFVENAIIKAKYYSQKTKLNAIADDSGLCIDLLDGAPGIFSARWAISENGIKDFKIAFNKIKILLEKRGIDVIKTKIKAYFFCSLVLFNYKNSKYEIFNGQCFGKLDLSDLEQKNGFGYDPIFMHENCNETFAKISEKQKNKISHRGLAFNKMASRL